jgi:hypothetical protein
LTRQALGDKTCIYICTGGNTGAPHLRHLSLSSKPIAPSLNSTFPLFGLFIVVKSLKTTARITFFFFFLFFLFFFPSFSFFRAELHSLSLSLSLCLCLASSGRPLSVGIYGDKKPSAHGRERPGKRSCPLHVQARFLLLGTLFVLSALC